MVAFLLMNPYTFRLYPGGLQRVNAFAIAPILFGAGLGAGISELTGGEWEQGAMYGAAGGAAVGLAAGAGAGGGGGIIGGGGGGGGMIQTVGGGIGGGQSSVPVMVGGEMGSLSQASSGGGGTTIPIVGDLFSAIEDDRFGDVASLGYSVYTSIEQRKLTEKAIEAQRRAGYVVGPGGTSLAPTTSIAIPAALAGAKGLDTKVLIKYGVIIVIGYFLYKGIK